jgi:hypothetical protein
MLYYKSRGNSIRHHKKTKNRPDARKNPAGVGDPSFATVKNPPKSPCRSLKVSGFAIKKKTRVVYAAYFAFRAMFTV